MSIFTTTVFCRPFGKPWPLLKISMMFPFLKNMIIHGVCPVFVILSIFAIFSCMICLHQNPIFFWPLKAHLILIGVWSMESSRLPWKISPRWKLWRHNTRIMTMQWNSEIAIWTILRLLLYLRIKWIPNIAWLSRNIKI